jgi:NADH-quinone oxidoreductase subunit N
MNYADLFRVTLPETALEVAALLVLDCGPWVFAQGCAEDARGCGGVAGGGWVRGGAVMGVVFAMMKPGSRVWKGGFEFTCWHGGYTSVAQIGILVLTALTLLLFIDSAFTKHVGEFVAVVLMAAAGGLLIAAAQDLLVIFVGLELLSLGLYILTAFAKSSGKSAEAAMKYYLFGGHVGGVSAVRVQLFLRSYWLDESAPDSIPHYGERAWSPLFYVALVW